MPRKCEKCGKEFEPEKSVYTRCPECAQKPKILPSVGAFHGGERPRGSTSPSARPANPGYGAFPSRPSGAHSAGSPPSRYEGESSMLPPECVMSTFYGPDGFLKREVYIEAAEKAARLFESNKMTQTSIRRLFNMLKATEQRIKTERDVVQAKGLACQSYYEFLRQVEYSNRRKNGSNPLIPDVFLQFGNKHLNTATASVKEFVGFVEYLTSIMARMKQK